MPDLFSDADEAKRQRLLAAGWTRTRRFGSERWVHPETGAWYSEKHALETLPPSVDDGAVDADTLASLKRAVASQKARQGEDVQAWAKKLAAVVGQATD